MKYKTPKREGLECRALANHPLTAQWLATIAGFLDSLPAEFEIVEPGSVQVRWPEGLNRERIIWLLQHPFSANFGELHGLAKIAPSMKKPKREAELWLHVSGQKLWKYPDDNWRLNSTGWRKVGECEVSE